MPADGAGSAGKEDTRSHNHSPSSRAVVDFGWMPSIGGRKKQAIESMSEIEILRQQWQGLSPAGRLQG